MYEENRAPKGKGEIGKIQEEMAIAHSRASYKSSYNGKKGKKKKERKKEKERKRQEKNDEREKTNENDPAPMTA